LWPAIYWHQWMIVQQPSNGSSANNHLLGEMAGLFISTVEWPYFLQSAKWREMSRNVLEKEIVKQTFPCGLNKEQAFSYHLFSLEFFLLAGIEGDRYGFTFSPTYKLWIRRMLEVIPVMTDFGGNLPRFGDADEGMALQLRPITSSRTDWLYRLGLTWLHAAVPVPNEGSGEMTASFLWKGALPRAKPKRFSRRKISLEDAGYFLLTSRRGQPDEIFCLADAGPLGYLSIAAHGHADALSFTVHIGGVPVIVDPGTFIYHADPVWRAYFRGTKAHNTLTVDNLDQSVAQGAFLWKTHARSKVLKWVETSQGGKLVAEHDGYSRLPGKIIHRRAISLNDKRLVTEDELLGGGKARAQYRLHFAPDCHVRLQDFTCAVEWAAGALLINLDRNLEWSVVRGGEDAGWYSSRFGVKEPTCTLIGEYEGEIPIKMLNQMEVFHAN
ncbi:MAG TPA: alginate lyase family protein, partial [Bacilli bacterium]